MNSNRSVQDYLNRQNGNNLRFHYCKQEQRLVRLEISKETQQEEMSDIRALYHSLEEKIEKGFASMNTRIMTGLGFIITILLTALGALIYDLLTK